MPMSEHANPSASSSCSDNNSDTPNTDSLGDRFMAYQRNSALADLMLVGDDGVQVPAVRYVLACTSPVLECMLYGNFLEARDRSTGGSTATIIPLHIGNHDLPCRSQALQVLVEYCCTNEITRRNSADDDDVMDLVTCAHLGHQYQFLGNLAAKIRQQILPRLQARPSLACWVLEHTDEVTTPELFRDALDVILRHPRDALAVDAEPPTTSSTNMRGGIRCLSADNVEAILSRIEMTAGTQRFYFQRLIDWKEANSDATVEAVNEDGSDDNENNNTCNKNDNKSTPPEQNATKLCREWVQRYFQLAWMDPVRDLPAIPAGFVDPQQLLQALWEQAQLAVSFGMNFAACRDAQSRPQCHVRVHGAARDEMNGLYVEVPSADRQRKHRRFCKLNEPDNELDPRFFIHVDIGPESNQWRMCDSYFPCYTVTTTNKQCYPSHGWKGHFLGPEHSPMCQWYIPKVLPRHIPSLGGSDESAVSAMRTISLEPTF